MKKFEILADDLEQQIREGLLQAGEKISSVREMSENRGLSINTVLKAYEHLERKGLLITKPQSGYYVLGPPQDKGLQFSTQASTIPVNIKIPELVGLILDVSKEKNLVQLGAAYLSPDLYPSEHITQITRQVLREFPEAISSYELSPGSFEYRRQISKQLHQVGCPISADKIIATSGAAEAVSLALRATCAPGSTVIVESPIFFGTLQAMEGLGLKVVEVRSHPTFGIDLEQLTKALKRNKVSAVVVMPNFSNPLGAAMSDENKKELISILEKYGVPAIEDDIYAELPFHGLRPKPLKAFDKSDSVITCSSFSKTVTPGLRIGWIAPGKYFNEIRRQQLSSTMGAGALAQKVMAQYISSKHYEKNMKRLRLHCSIQVNKTAQDVLTNFPIGTRISLPKGGFVLWVELPKKVDSLDLYRKALEKKISFSPGVLFSASGQYRNFLRLSCGTVWSTKLEESLRTLGTLAKRY